MLFAALAQGCLVDLDCELEGYDWAYRSRVSAPGYVMSLDVTRLGDGPLRLARAGTLRIALSMTTTRPEREYNTFDAR